MYNKVVARVLLILFVLCFIIITISGIYIFFQWRSYPSQIRFPLAKLKFYDMSPTFDASDWQSLYEVELAKVRNTNPELLISFCFNIILNCKLDASSHYCFWEQLSIEEKQKLINKLREYIKNKDFKRLPYWKQSLIQSDIQAFEHSAM